MEKNKSNGVSNIGRVINTSFGTITLQLTFEELNKYTDEQIQSYIQTGEFVVLNKNGEK